MPDDQARKDQLIIELVAKVGALTEGLASFKKGGENLLNGEDQKAFGVKLDLIIDRLNRVEIALTMQQTALSIRVDHLKQEVDQMIGGRINPYWINAILTGAGLVLGYLVGLKIGR